MSLCDGVNLDDINLVKPKIRIRYELYENLTSYYLHLGQMTNVVNRSQFYVINEA